MLDVSAIYLTSMQVLLMRVEITDLLVLVASWSQRFPVPISWISRILGPPGFCVDAKYHSSVVHACPASSLPMVPLP